MRIRRDSIAFLCFCCLAIFAQLPAECLAADSLIWNTNTSQVSADIKSEKLPALLEKVASATGWQVFLEPDPERSVSATFDRVGPGEALHLMPGDINFAVVPRPNSSPRLFVFRTFQERATQEVQPLKPGTKGSASKVIPNELVVRLKPGVKIEELAKLLGAKVVGRIDSLNAYRLQFDDAAATTTARDQLAGNPDVASVDSNYTVERPEAAQLLPSGAPPIQLQLKPPPDNGRIIVGLVDTAVQTLRQKL